jgi:hypothetical protein
MSSMRAIRLIGCSTSASCIRPIRRQLKRHSYTVYEQEEVLAREHAELALTAMRKSLEKPQLIDETSGLELFKSTEVEESETSGVTSSRQLRLYANKSCSNSERGLRK